MKILKKLSKVVAISTVCALAVTPIVGCESAAEDEAPVITGAGDFDCIVNEPVDLLRKVAALDKEDGDITPQMTIDIVPEVQVKDGIAVFPTDDEYEITYSVKDSAGHKTSATSYVSVYTRPLYKSFDTVDMNGFSVDVSGAAKLVTQSVVGDGDRSKLGFKVTGAAAAEDVSLTRTYALNGGVDYTLTYKVKSNVAGTAKAKIGETVIDNLAVAEGEYSDLTFEYSVPESEQPVDVKVQLLLGALGDNLEIEFDKASVSYELEQQEGGTPITFTDGNVHDRFDGTEGTVNIAEDGSSATLTITSAASGADDMWRGGMFINTGIPLYVGGTYTISFDLESENEGDFEVCILNSQWGPGEFIEAIPDLVKNGKTERTITVDEGKGGTLWLYVRSGTNINTITISNLLVDIDNTNASNETVVSFTDGNVHDRFDRNDGGATLEGSVSVAEDNSSATLTITAPASGADDMWRGGMFINTGVALVEGGTYNISFNLVSANEGDFEVCILNSQWGPDEFIEVIPNIVKNGANTRELTVPSGKGGTLWLYVRSGTNVNTITISNLKISTETVGSDETTVSFGSNVHDRFDRNDGGATLEGSVSVAEDNSSATLTITSAASGAEDMWRGGMFINTGVALVEGSTYNISFNLVSANEGDFEVCILNSQWGPDEFIEVIPNIVKNGANARELTVPSGKGGTLWLYVRSGTNVNTITISNLKISKDGNDGGSGGASGGSVTRTETYGCNNVFKMFAHNGAPNYVQWVDGKLVYHVDEFGNTDWHNKIEGVNFDITAGAFGDFYVSFTAKASKAVTARVIAPRSGGWDPNLVWAQFQITEEETLFTFRCNAIDLPGTNHLEWQFGEVNYNLGLEDVTIEIGDIAIYYKSIIE
ncbi:MAG: hypothetical protein J1F39_02330 [Clostridiales bacterium]|nr:hypothetical protein [Clostridiales bacterium]